MKDWLINMTAVLADGKIIKTRKDHGRGLLAQLVLENT
jgi:FAD/FMN-containing dehydrogenase